MRTEIHAMTKAAGAFWSRLRDKGEEEANEGIGLALGGGFARAVAHIGVLRVLERERIPVGFVAGVSAGSIVAAGLAGGANAEDLELVARSMKFKDLAGWRFSRLGLVGSERMEGFLRHAFPVYRFEEMKIPLAVVATDLKTGNAVVFHGPGEVFHPVRASCSYPGLFLPVRYEGKLLVDGGISMEIPAAALRGLGMKRVVSVVLPAPPITADPGSMFGVVNRCFQIMQHRTEQFWRFHSDVVIAPQVQDVAWDDFTQVGRMIEAGVKAAEAAMPQIRALMRQAVVATGGLQAVSAS
ncbi:MAG: patatin-like phospholipase family protein [Bryobacterales bacterium]|nr:patatin-like phospholipase family protein [Bryobacterales bacterium]